VVLLGVPSERLAKKQLDGSVEEILRNVASILNSMILNAIEKKTAHEFRAVYVEGFPVYIRLIGALSEILQATVKRSVIERMVFTVWTLRKIDELANVVVAGELPDGEKQRDREYANQFLVAALWARFNIDFFEMDDEDKELLRESMYDMDHEEVGFSIFKLEHDKPAITP
jgi:hypothetical protein